MKLFRSACLGLIASFGLLAFVTGEATAQKRVALVVGNSAYRHAIPLNNPRNDAADMASVLRELGFQVIEARDVDKAAFDSQLREFAYALQGADTAMFFYAGHGMQVDGRNYVVPVDARLSNAAMLTVETVDVVRVLEPLPSNVPIDSAILRLVETHPFFANAPAVQVQRYLTSEVWSMSRKDGGSKSNSEYDTRVRQLR